MASGLSWAVLGLFRMVRIALFALVGPCFDENIVRMLLKNGYRHVYISRKFALKHGFIPGDAAPGHYGYGGLVKYVSLTTSSSHYMLNKCRHV